MAAADVVLVLHFCMLRAVVDGDRRSDLDNDIVYTHVVQHVAWHVWRMAAAAAAAYVAYMCGMAYMSASRPGGIYPFTFSAFSACIYEHAHSQRVIGDRDDVGFDSRSS